MTSISSNTDVVVDNPSTGDILTYDGSKWINLPGPTNVFNHVRTSWNTPESDQDIHISPMDTVFTTIIPNQTIMIKAMICHETDYDNVFAIQIDGTEEGSSTSINAGYPQGLCSLNFDKTSTSFQYKTTIPTPGEHTLSLHLKGPDGASRPFYLNSSGMWETTGETSTSSISIDLM